MHRTWLASGSASMVIAVAAGAFGAHALRSRLAPDLLAAFEVGVRYQAYHALALLAVSILAEQHGGRPLVVAGVAFVSGTILFSGSLYAIALTGLRGLGVLTPLGGVLFLVGWLSLLWSAFAPQPPPR